jgi:hypothetical protein
MRLPIICAQCMREDLASARPFMTMEWHDDGRYEATCSKGHKSITVLQEQKFELLFDIGAYALADGYYREAVSSFASSLERFYEFFITAVLLEKGVGGDMIQQTWKHVANLSERQLGAFIFLHLSELYKCPPVLGPKSVNFRNAVIHKGKIPSRAEALKYGQEILDLVRPLVQELKQRSPKGVQATIFQHIKRSHPDPTRPSGTMAIATIISLSRDDKAYNERSLDAALRDLKRWEIKSGTLTVGGSSPATST